MARSIRIEYEDAYYHVLARGNQRALIFLDDDDRNYFLKTLDDACEKTGWRIHAWVLMGNHYHLFVQTPEANLVAGMKWLQNTYTRRFNIRHKNWGRIFGDRYKAILVEGDNNYYYETMLNYIHLNPVRARLVRLDEEQSILDFPWSSLTQAYVLPPERRKKWMACSDGLKALGFSDTHSERKEMVEYLERRAIKEEADRCGIPITDDEVGVRLANLRKGWYWGTKVFLEKMLLHVDSSLGKQQSRAYHTTLENKSHGEQQAEYWFKEGLDKAHLIKEDLEDLKGSDPRKILIAFLLRKKTTVPNGWIASQLKMKSAANVGQQLRRINLKKVAKKVPEDLVSYMIAKGIEMK